MLKIIINLPRRVKLNDRIPQETLYIWLQYLNSMSKDKQEEEEEELTAL